MLHTIECAQLDFDDTTFLMSYPLESPSVTASVETIGVLHPIVVSGCPCHGGYQIVSGFRRAYACRAIGIETIAANIYPVDPENQLAGFCLALFENLSHRHFNEVEKSLILAKLLNRFGCSREEVVQYYMPLLHLAPKEKVLNTYLHLAEFEKEHQHYIAEHDLPLTALELLAPLHAADRNAVFMLLTTLKLGVNKLKEVLTSLEEIALRDTCSIHDILTTPQVRDIIEHERYSGPQKAEQLRQHIRTLRYPQLTILEHEYQRQLKGLHPGQGIRVTTDRNFEDDALSTTLRFTTPEQLRALAEQLLTLSDKPELQGLLDLIQGKTALEG